MNREWIDKGIKFYEQGKSEEAVKAFDRAIEINPQQADAWMIKGIALEDLGKRDEAILAYRKAIEINPAMPKPAALMDISGFNSVSEWFKAVKAEGLTFPLAMPHGLEMAMKELKLSFPETFNLLAQRGIILPLGYTFIYVMKSNDVQDG